MSIEKQQWLIVCSLIFVSRLHVPIRDRRVFDEIIQRSVGKTYSEDRMSQTTGRNLQDYHQSHSSPLLTHHEDSSSAAPLSQSRSRLEPQEIGVLHRVENPFRLYPFDCQNICYIKYGCRETQPRTIIG